MHLKIILSLLVLTAAKINGAANLIGTESLSFFEKEEWLIPTLDGSSVVMSLVEYLKQKLFFKSCNTPIYLHLYTNETIGNPQIVNIDNPIELESLNFDPTILTHLVTHGWTDSCKDDVNVLLGPALLASGPPSQVMCIDWSSSAQTINYPNARHCVANAGKRVAKFVDYLCEELGYDVKLITCSGHSLGAHVCGYVGKSVSYGKISRIYGLDTAYPLFLWKDSSTRLSSNDACYVETIHTSPLGFALPVGTASFYPNGGLTQPACNGNPFCAHPIVINYMIEGLLEDSFATCKVDSYSDLAFTKCESSNTDVRMVSPYNYNYNATGESCNQGVSGIFYVPVNDESPYGENV